MPSKRPQFNFRLDPETEARLERLQELAIRAIGIEQSVSDLVKLGLVELERKWSASQDTRPTEPKKRAPKKA